MNDSASAPRYVLLVDARSDVAHARHLAEQSGRLTVQTYQSDPDGPPSPAWFIALPLDTTPEESGA